MPNRILITEDNFNEIDLEAWYGYGAIDTETNGLNSFKGDRIIGISFYFPAIDTSYYISIRHAETRNISYLQYQVLLARIPKMVGTWVLFNSKFDMHMLKADGMGNLTRIEDVILAAQLTNENEWVSHGQTKGAFTLKRLAKKYLGEDAVAGEEALIEAAKARGINPKSEMWKMPASEVALYAMMDTEITWGLREFYKPALERWQQWDLYLSRNEFVLKALFRMEQNGIRVDVPTIHEHREAIAPKLEEIQKRFDTAVIDAGLNFNGAAKKDERRINLQSPQQVKAFFQWKGYTIPDTGALTLHGLANNGDKFAVDMLEHRRLSKADNTYYAPYLHLVDPNSEIHTNFNAIGTDTGRLSSDNPNLQNIPRTGRVDVKKVFITRPGKLLVGSDYKALELRLAAHFANEEQIVKVFQAGGDPHQLTADLMGIDRNLAKTFNFGLLYGMGWKRAMLSFGLPSEREAKRLVNGWHDTYPAFRKAVNHYQKLANTKRGYIETDEGKFQYIRLFNGRTRKYQELLKYGYDYTKDAFNFLVQGTGAAVNEISITRVVNYFKDNDTFIPMLAVHDSFVYEIPLELEEITLPVVTELMQDWDFSVPLLIDTKTSTEGYYYL